MVMLSWCIGFVVTEYIQLAILLTSETLDMQEISFNTCITLLFTCIGLRAVIIYFSPISEDIIQSVIDSEKVTYLDDAEVIIMHFFLFFMFVLLVLVHETGEETPRKRTPDIALLFHSSFIYYSTTLCIFLFQRT